MLDRYLFRGEKQGAAKAELATVTPGGKFKYGGVEWIALESDQDGGTLAITADITEYKAFSIENNDWRTSSVREYLNADAGCATFGKGFLADLLDNGANLNDFMEIVSDLTADNGQRDYGTATDYIALLTADLFRKYRGLLLLEGDELKGDYWYWTLTPWSCAAFSRNVRRVRSGGTLSHTFAWNSSIGLRPLCYLKSEALVSIYRSEGLEDEEDLKNDA